MESDKPASSILPKSKHKNITNEDVVNFHKNQWKEHSREMGDLYQQVETKSKFVASGDDDWVKLVKYLMEQIMDEARETGSVELDNSKFLILKANENIIKNALESISYTFSKIDKRKIYCRLQAFMDNYYE